jgi:hypothetical protein
MPETKAKQRSKLDLLINGILIVELSTFRSPSPPTTMAREGQQPRRTSKHSRLRRKQFSSCDACRKSRVACDASQLSQVEVQVQDGEVSGADSTGRVPSPYDIKCTNCSRRSVECTYNVSCSIIRFFCYRCNKPADQLEQWMRDASDTRTERARNRTQRGTMGQKPYTATPAHPSPQSDLARSCRHDSTSVDPSTLQSNCFTCDKSFRYVYSFD